MLSFFQKRMRDDKGFTLIELMVVVLIIAILIAIAIPTFLGLRTRSQNRAAQSNLRNALTAAKSFYTDSETYTPAAGNFNAADGAATEPSLTWNDAAASVAGEVSVRGVTATTVVLVTESASGSNFCLYDSNGTTGYGDDDAANVAACAGGW